MIFWDIHLSALPIHVFGTRESREYPMHVEQQSVGTIYRQSGCFRNGDNDLRASIDVPSQTAAFARYVTRGQGAGHGLQILEAASRMGRCQMSQAITIRYVRAAFHSPCFM